MFLSKRYLSIKVSVCSSLISVALRDVMARSVLRRKNLFNLTGYNPSLKETKAGTAGGRNSPYWLATSGLLSHSAQAYLPSDDVIHMGWILLHQLVINKTLRGCVHGSI